MSNDRVGIYVLIDTNAPPSDRLVCIGESRTDLVQPWNKWERWKRLTTHDTNMEVRWNPPGINPKWYDNEWWASVYKAVR